MPPPSQAGKFKPRKPPKKIKVGGAAGSAKTSASVAAGGGAAASGSRTNTASSPKGRGSSRGNEAAGRDNAGGGGRGRGRGRGRGGRGGGRGGRGGRKPIVMPRGTVFFTGNQAPTAAAKKGSASTGGGGRGGASGAAAGRGLGIGAIVEKKDNMSDEVIVGELDEAIGSSKEHVKKNPLLSGSSDKPSMFQDDEAEPTYSSVAETYDSDSSMEEEKRSRQKHATSFMPPTQLPFPVAAVPAGIGSQELPRALYACALEDDEKEAAQSAMEEEQSDPPRFSPFVDCDNAKDRQQEEQSWFLMQFPTRMPPMTGGAANIKGEAKSEVDAVTSDGQPVAPQSLIPDSAPSSASLAPNSSEGLNSYDNAFRQAGPGKIGKIVVYKSGKTVLVMGGEHGSPEIRMNVKEGLQCGFLQQAVAIDTVEGDYVPLGDVKKTVVVTPDVESAFSIA